MQLVSLQSLLVLGVLTLPALSASLPRSATATGHSLHRRADGSSKGSAGSPSIKSWSRVDQAARLASESSAGSSSTPQSSSMRTTERNEGNQQAIGEEYGTFLGEGDTPTDFGLSGFSSKSRLLPLHQKAVSPDHDWKAGKDVNDKSSRPGEMSDARLSQDNNLGNNGVTPAVSFFDVVIPKQAPDSNDPIAVGCYDDGKKLKEQLDAGLLRFTDSEEKFYQMVKRAINLSEDPWLSADSHGAKLLLLCDKVLAKIEAEPRGPMKYDRLFALSLTSFIEKNVKDSKLKDKLRYAKISAFGYFGTYFPADAKDIIAVGLLNMKTMNPRVDIDSQTATVYDFFNQYVFGYRIRPTNESDTIVRDLISSGGSELPSHLTRDFLDNKANLVEGLIVELGNNYHEDWIERILKHIKIVPELPSKL